jgi:hypothetical protein
MTYTDTIAIGHTGGHSEACIGGDLCHLVSPFTVTLTRPSRECGAVRFTRLQLGGQSYALNSVTCTAYQETPHTQVTGWRSGIS